MPDFGQLSCWKMEMIPDFGQLMTNKCCLSDDKWMKEHFKMKKEHFKST